MDSICSAVTSSSSFYREHRGLREGLLLLLLLLLVFLVSDESKGRSAAQEKKRKERLKTDIKELNSERFIMFYTFFQCLFPPSPIGDLGSFRSGGSAFLALIRRRGRRRRL